MGVVKYNKIEVLLFLKKYGIINHNSYLSYLIDGKDTNETLTNSLKDKDIAKIKNIKNGLKKNKKESRVKLFLQDFEYLILAIAYILLILDIFSSRDVTLRGYIIISLISCSFGIFTIKIFKSDYKTKIRKINSELNIINYIENKICINN